MTRGIDNNNPGNIDFNERNFERDRWIGELGLEKRDNPRFTSFTHAVYGVRAICKILLTYQSKYKLMTIRGMVSRWAPPNENDTESYIKFVADFTNFFADEDVDFSKNTLVFASIVEAIIHMENGISPYPAPTIELAVTLALLK